MCLSAPKSHPPPRSSSRHHSEKDRFPSGSSSGSATDTSLPASPDLRKQQLPVGRVVISTPRSSSAKYPAPPQSRRNSTRRNSGRASVPATPRRKSSKRGTPVTSPTLSEFNYKISGTTPRSKTTPRIIRTPAASTQTTPRVGATPGGSPRKSKANSTTSSQGRLSVATANSLAASTSPLLKPGGGSSRSSSDAGSSRTSGSNARDRRRLSKATDARGLIGLGITTEVLPKKKRTPERTASVMALFTAPVASENPMAPVPTIRVHSAAATVTSTTVPKAMPSPAATKSPTDPGAAPTQATTTTAAAQPQTRPPIVRQNAYVPAPAPQLRRKGSSSSLSSTYSKSSISTASTIEALVPEITDRAPSSYSYVPVKPLAELPAEAAQLAHPVPLPAHQPEKEITRERKEAPLPQEPVVPKIPAPEPVEKPAKGLEDELIEEPMKEKVKTGHHCSLPLLETPVKKPSPPRIGRPSSRASVETVDYAAFVAESQKKKKQQKMRSLLPNDAPTPGRRTNSVRAKAALFSSLSAAATAPAPARPMPTVGEDPNAIARKMALARVHSEDSNEESDASTEVSSVAAAAGNEFPHRSNQLRRQSSPPVSKTLYKTDASSMLSYRVDSAPPSEAPSPLPYAPSPPQFAQRSSAGVQEHMPPQGAAESWYNKVGAGPRELEQDWVHSAEVWEQDPILPEAPSPPVSRTENRHHRRRSHRSHRKSSHGQGNMHSQHAYYAYSSGHY